MFNEFMLMTLLILFPDAPINPLVLKLPVQHRVNFDTGCDQGYGSERSPEEEVPPTLPSLMNGLDPFNINGPPALMMMGPPIALAPPATTSNSQRTTDDRFDCGDYDFITKGMYTRATLLGHWFCF